ncbi:MAG TPA: GntR family transcriptional regulator, partial [Bradyrhizobium sp.]|nr:GntR family transcriptional regulator [Bradyrhizobium sp.]
MLHEEVVSRIRAILLDGEITPGARIPERELCERLQISRTPLREALKVLAAEGLVQLLPNRGSRAAKLTDKDVRDLFEVCQGLEALAGELACERITDAEIDEIA